MALDGGGGRGGGYRFENITSLNSFKTLIFFRQPSKTQTTEDDKVILLKYIWKPV